MRPNEWFARWGPRWREVKQLCIERKGVYNTLIRRRAKADKSDKHFTASDVAAFLDRTKPLSERLPLDVPKTIC